MERKVEQLEHQIEDLLKKNEELRNIIGEKRKEAIKASVAAIKYRQKLIKHTSKKK